LPLEIVSQVLVMSSQIPWRRPVVTSHQKSSNPQSFKIEATSFKIEVTRLSASLLGLDSSQALPAGKLW